MHCTMYVVRTWPRKRVVHEHENDGCCWKYLTKNPKTISPQRASTWKAFLTGSSHVVEHVQCTK